ncbi:hypothetical protein GALMADRAFT_599483 [Galerina marginata CBS 339.88]|uniref:DUF4470 domain-containing protein n=1 Tax=Galerina marginata (strain CBS 339.88) TaxID=685588 RepID=A0A067T4W7_GALM3|nr:hypothetical protein GALMADRAFT_599483 [Galerina marginata CBS 339.88]
MAEELNQKGTSSYKAGDFAEAQRLFKQASQVNPDEPKYLSNLSAAEYEEGKYDQSIQSLVLAWQKINLRVVDDLSTEWDALRFKLAARFAKANLHINANQTASFYNGNRDGLIREEIEKYVVLQQASLPDTKTKEIVTIWDEWRRVRDECLTHSPAECEAGLSMAQKRFRALEIYKGAFDPTLEYYTFGHDDIVSLLDGFGEPDKLLSTQLDDSERRDCLSFLFGGSGDARHVFGTIIDTAGKLFENVERGAQTPSVHFTLVDIHPVPLARLLVIFQLLRMISLVENPLEEMELQTTLSYLYISIVIPDYCNQMRVLQISVQGASSMFHRVLNVARGLSIALENGLLRHLPSWLHIHQKCIPAIVEVLRYWSNPLPKTTQIMLELHSDLGKTKPGGMNFRDMLPPENPAQDSDPYWNPHAEPVIYDFLKVVLPPRQLLQRHPALAQLASSYRRADPKTAKAATHEVWRTWKPNPTLFDPISIETPKLGPKLCHKGGYPIISTTALEIMFALAGFNFRVDGEIILPFGPGAVSMVARFFELVADAVVTLEDCLKIELVHGEVMSGAPRLVTGELGERPQDFPVTFTRTWMSNVPDYTNGILNTIIYILPLHPTTSSDAMSPMTLSNCLWNTSAFNSVDEFCYTYTLLNQAEIENFLGCRFTVTPTPTAKQNKVWGQHVLVPLVLPRPLNELPTKTRLHRWLSHLLICTLCNGIPQPPLQRIVLPNNLHPFFQLLVRLQMVGYPSHWLGEFVQMIVSDTLVTDMKPYLGLLPIPPSAGQDKTRSPRKVHLSAWRLELEAILATIRPALPFYVAIPKEYPSLDDIHTYRASVISLDFPRHPYFQILAPIGSPFIKSVGLIFHKPNLHYEAEDLAKKVSNILEGDLGFSDVQIVLGADIVDLPKGVIEWRMSRTWYELMKKDKWKMAAYRTDLQIAVTESLDAGSWLDTM